MKCECMNWCWDESTAIIKNEDVHHHPKCEKFRTQKYPYLFYYEDAVDYWIPFCDGSIDPDQYDEDEVFDIQFKRVDLTDKEWVEMFED